jgi:hypothetical protein
MEQPGPRQAVTAFPFIPDPQPVNPKYKRATRFLWLPFFVGTGSINPYTKIALYCRVLVIKNCDQLDAKTRLRPDGLQFSRLDSPTKSFITCTRKIFRKIMDTNQAWVTSTKPFSTSGPKIVSSLANGSPIISAISKSVLVPSQ